MHLSIFLLFSFFCNYSISLSSLSLYLPFYFSFVYYSFQFISYYCRAGPGVKSFVKRARRSLDLTAAAEPMKKHKHVYKPKKKKPPPPARTDSPLAFTRQTDSPLSNYSDETGLGSDGSRAQTPVELMTSGGYRTQTPPQKRSPSLADSLMCGFFDSSMWKRVETCCGPVFTGPHGETMIDRRFYRPCTGNRLGHIVKPLVVAAVAAQQPVVTVSEKPANAIYPPKISETLSEISETSSVEMRESSVERDAVDFESLIESELKAFSRLQQPAQPTTAAASDRETPHSMEVYSFLLYILLTNYVILCAYFY